jgi:hydroxylamine reductase
VPKDRVILTPAVLNVLVQKFNLMPITTPDADLKAILKKAA